MSASLFSARAKNKNMRRIKGLLPLKTTTIRQTRFFKAEPADVYEALVDPKKHTAFTGSKATFQPRVGGRFTAWDGYIFGKNLELKRGKKLVQEWQTTEWPEGYPPSVLEFSFLPKAGGTQLVMVQSKVPAEQAANYRQGWIDSYWNPLKGYLLKKAPPAKS
jgi:activator of HSP90 ATPase